MAIHTLSLDVETFSDVDLKKCGVYKYAESSDFEILLFGVSVDGGEVTVYDLASGDTVPEEIIRALADDSVGVQCVLRAGLPFRLAETELSAVFFFLQHRG